MVIEIREKGSKAFYEEVVSFNHQYAALMKNPRAKFRSSFKSIFTQVFAMAFLFGCMTYWGLSDGFSPLAVFAI